MSLAVYLSFIVTCFVIEITPGPNMAYLAVLSASKGRKAGFAATVGIALGLFIVGMAAALGVATLISNSPLAYQMLRWGGVAYLFWLAWDGWRDEQDEIDAQEGAVLRHAKFFKRGLIVNLLNPKAAVFYIAILPGFIDAASMAAAQAVMLTVTYVAVATLIHSMISVLAGSARAFLENRKRRLIARRVLSVALAAIAIWFAFSTGQSG